MKRVGIWVSNGTRWQNGHYQSEIPYKKQETGITFRLSKDVYMGITFKLRLEQINEITFRLEDEGGD